MEIVLDTVFKVFADWLVGIQSHVLESAVVTIAVFFLIWLCLWSPMGFLLGWILKWRPPTPLTPAQKLPLVVSLYAIAPLVLWAFARVEHYPFRTYGLVWNVSFLKSVGLGLGMALLSLVVLFGVYQWRGWSQWQPKQIPVLKALVLPSLLLGAWISAIEELVFRGFILNQLLREYSWLVAMLVSSIIFALLHLVWEQQETRPQLAGLWLMGMVLVWARWVDQGSLGLAMGLHLGWVAGMVSLDSAQMIQYEDLAPSWITGIGNKPLAGLSGLCLLLATGLMIGLLNWNSAVKFFVASLVSPG